MVRALCVAMLLAGLVVTRPARAEVSTELRAHVGTRRATLGPAFGAVALGTVGEVSLPAATPGVTIELVRTGRRLDAVELTIADEACADLHAWLVQTWGAPHEIDGSIAEHWTSRAATTGASFEVGSFEQPCHLRIFRRVSPAQWLGRTRGSVVPLWALGKSVAPLERALAALQPTRNGDDLRWEDTAIDGTPSALRATVRKGRIVRIEVDVEQPVPAWRRLVAVFGAPRPATREDDTVRWRWGRSPPVEVTTFAGTGTVAPVGRARREPPIPRAPDGFPITIVIGAPDASPSGPATDGSTR